MAIVRTGESEYDKELEKWSLPKREGGYNANGYEAFPSMLYKAQRNHAGKALVTDMDAFYAVDMNAVARAEAFNRANQLTVGNQHELDRALSDGWRRSPDEALDHFEGLQQDIAQAAAEEAYRVKRMGEKAQAEYHAADEATDAPVAEVAAPKKAPRGTRVATVS